MLALLDEEQQNFMTTLYEDYKHLIFTIAMKHLNDRRDAEDVLQTVMIKIINHIYSFERRLDDELKSLISTYAGNVAKDYYRKNKRRNENEASLGTTGEDDDEISNDISNTSFNLEDLVITNEMIEIVKKALLKLNQKDQEIITLRLIQEQPSQTVADMLDITVNAVDLRYKKAKERLLKLIGDELR